MQVSVENTSAIGRRMTIGVPASQVDSEVEKRLQKTARTTKLNGFRPGKVPMSVVRRRYGEGVRQEVVGEVMRDSYLKALQQESINPAGFPQFEPKKLDKGEDIEFVAVFEVYPDVTLNDVSNIKVVKQETEVADADIDKMIDMLQKQATTWAAKEDGAAEGDKVTMDYRGELDGEAFEGGTANGASIEIGSKSMIPGFEDGLVGLKAEDERVLDLTFPEDYHAENLKGKATQFHVKVLKVEAPELPEVDEAFFAQYGVEEGGLDAFRAELKNNMERESQFAINNKVKNQIVDQLVEQNELEVPSSLVKQEIDKMKQEAAQRFGLGENTDNIPDELFKDQASKRVKTGLLFAQIVKENELKASDDQIEAKVKELAASYQDPEEVVSYYLNNQEQKAQMESVVLEDVVVDHILDKAGIEVEKVSYEDAVKPASPEPAKTEDSDESEPESGE